MDVEHGLTLELDASVLPFHAHAFLVDGFHQAGPNPAMNVDGQADHAVRKRGQIGNLCASLVVLGVLCGKKSRSHNRFALASWGAGSTNWPAPTAISIRATKKMARLFPGKRAKPEYKNQCALFNMQAAECNSRFDVYQ